MMFQDGITYEWVPWKKITDLSEHAQYRSIMKILFDFRFFEIFENPSHFRDDPARSVL